MRMLCPLACLRRRQELLADLIFGRHVPVGSQRVDGAGDDLGKALDQLFARQAGTLRKFSEIVAADRLFNLVGAKALLMIWGGERLLSFARGRRRGK